jgi:tRNA pseudouridine32 synthase/23S rRNA pseudouridine746 synthase
VKLSGVHLYWILEPLTGRAHQLRFELSRHGYPIVGDVLYGAKDIFEKGIALRAIELDLSKVNDRFGLPEKLQAPTRFV